MSIETCRSENDLHLLPSHTLLCHYRLFDRPFELLPPWGPTHFCKQAWPCWSSIPSGSVCCHFDAGVYGLEVVKLRGWSLCIHVLYKSLVFYEKLMGDQCATQAAPGSAFTAIRSVMICALQGNRSDINKATSPVRIIILSVFSYWWPTRS